ncbi:MAG: hypothetical protein JNK72_17655 [Myxococcales bacterium]|nr:hypothetical protein [Myxococcales bacterium]
MPRPFVTVASAETPDGVLALKQRDTRDFLITHQGRVLMNSMAHRSEQMLGTLACAPLKHRKSPRVLVGGLGMAITLRAVLDSLPADAEVVVAELNPVMLAWCRGPLAALTDRAVDDPRVRVLIADVTAVIADAANTGLLYDAILIDLYVGPHAHTPASDKLYGVGASTRARDALTRGGVYTVWGESYHKQFAETLTRAGFTVTHERPGRGGMRHVVYVGTRAA